MRENRLGRLRRTREDLHASIAEYRLKYGLEPSADLPGCPPKTLEEQTRAWHRLYKMRLRIEQRERGVCQRCNAAAIPASVFCADHRSKNQHGHSITLDERKALHAQQSELCPVCLQRVDMWDEVDHEHKRGHVRGILHAKCNKALAWLELLQQSDSIERALGYIARR